MSKKNLLFIHITFWVFLVLPISCASLVMFFVKPKILYTFLPDATFSYVVMDALYNVCSFGITFYAFYFLVFEWIFRNENWKEGLAKTMCLFFGLGIIEQTIIVILYPEDLIDTSLVFESIMMFVWLLFRMGLAVGARALVAFLNEQKKRKELEKFNLQSELSLFRAQVNPHFLFNTLNNIDALIYSDQDKASDTLIKLSKQMRYMLYESNVEQIDLNLELEFVQNYIELERIRLKNKDFVNFTIEGNPNGIMVAPMLFIAFIENAFKHCTTTEETNGLVIRFVLKSSAIIFECSNRYEVAQTKKKVKYSGVGLELVQKRLNLIYPQRHQLSIDNKGGLFQVHLKLA